MATADGPNRQRDVLPSISHLELDRLKTDRPETRFPPINGLSVSTAPMDSPNTVHSGPPPPYSSYAPSTAGSNQAISGYISPPESTTRRSTREDEKASPGRKSLPSIHEALGGERSLPFSAGSQPASGSNPSTAITQNFPEAPRGPSNPFSAPSFRDNTFSSQPQSNPQPPSDLRSKESAPFLHPPSPRTSAPSYQTGPLASSTFNSRVDPQPPHSPSHLEQQRQSYSFPPISKPTSSSYNNESFQFPGATNLHEQRPTFARGPEVSYEQTIKRHIDVHEAAKDLNDVRETSLRFYDVSQNWTHRYHQGNRSGFFQDSLPPLHEIDDMMRNAHLMMDNLARVKEVVIQQQNALSEHRARFARGSLEDDYQGIADDYKAGGFAGGDAKKRRGKAAPPGRCHSCNRAETPEWRRGPDGARTLCNACGLHYAKLTRKIGVNKAAAMTGSNLRPKGLDPRP